MKILLIQPNPRGYYAWPVCACIPLGLLYIAAALRRTEGRQIEIMDARCENLGQKAIAARITQFAPDVVGITGLNPEASAVLAVASLAKKAAPACKVIVGGPYAITSPEEALFCPDIDFAVLGEGEETACALIEALETGSLKFAAIDGLAFRENGLVVVNKRRAPIEDIDGIPFPAWDLVNVKKYFGLWVRHSQNPFPASQRIMPVFTSRGCPYGCIFCHNIFGKKTRLRSVESVMREIELLVEKYRIGEIEIIDDIFNIDLPRAEKICDEIIRRGIKIKLSFPNGLRVDTMDEELLLKLKKAGLHLLAYAIESGSPAVQKRMGKHLNLEKAARMARFTNEQGIFFGGFFMLGFPGETREELQATLRFSREVPFHQANFFFVTPRPNTVLYEMAAKQIGGVGKVAHASYFRFSVNLSAVSDEELQKTMEEAEAYYAHPLRFLRAFLKIPDKLYVLRLVLRAFFLRRFA
ncbi:MAG: hypothetical protein COT18_11490 [Elusimicrobia bacterium CG08_land_8_20_14_0_20_59_10]|nr:MAG: hypothetical protein COT18_11490 [Elusimicrobia bacterium CG08_land_8_20_14_0_20_59_10]